MKNKTKQEKLKPFNVNTVSPGFAEEMASGKNEKRTVEAPRAEGRGLKYED